MDKVLNQAINLSSGTIASLTGKRKYSDIEKIQGEFVEFVKGSSKKYSKWQDAWKDFWKGTNESKLRKAIREEIRRQLKEVDGQSDADELAEKMEKIAKKHFPKSPVNAKFSSRLYPSITLYFMVGQKNDVYNQIAQNDVSYTIIMVDDGFDREGNIKGKLSFEVSQGGSIAVKPEEGSYLAYDRVKFSARKTSGNPDKILKAVDTYFKRLKQTLKDNVDRLSNSHEYAKKYI